MLFSTKAEYGVRLMVALGREAGERPVALASLASAAGMPISAESEYLPPELYKARV